MCGSGYSPAIEATHLWVGLQPDDRSDVFVGRASARRRSSPQGTCSNRVGLKADPQEQRSNTEHHGRTEREPGQESSR